LWTLRAGGCELAKKLHQRKQRCAIATNEAVVPWALPSQYNQPDAVAVTEGISLLTKHECNTMEKGGEL
jgi:hypothetical protein